MSWRVLITLSMFVILFAIEETMQITGIGAPWTTTIGDWRLLGIGAFVCDYSIWILDIIPCWLIIGIAWILNKGTTKQFAFTCVKWIVWLFCGYWLMWDMVFIALFAVAKP
nr:hypothetical protein [Candidatus Sigynarchaeota archaeon]